MDVPIACTLTVPELSERRRRVAELADRSLMLREPLPEGVRLFFAADRATEREVRAVVAAEARCCSFLRLRLRRTGKALVLDVTGPQQARPIIDELFT
jgi:hypothetical protein